MTTTMVLGADSGVGFEVAKRCGQNGQRIVLVSRNQAKLTAATAELTALGIAATNQVCDVTDFQALAAMIHVVAQQEPGLTTLIFNVGDKHLDDPLASDSAVIQDIFRTNVVSAIVAAKAFIHETDATRQRAILFTGGGAAVHPSAKASTLSLTKAALRSYAYTLHDQVADQGVYVGLVTIQGLIGTSADMQPARIAETYWQLLQQRNSVEAFYPEHVAGSEFN